MYDVTGTIPILRHKTRDCGMRDRTVKKKANVRGL
jgi:hypothetical protein